MELKNKNFSIISDNCFGEYLYQQFHLPYQTPFIGLFLFSSDYIYLLKNLYSTLYNKLIFIDANHSNYKEELIKSSTLNTYPIAKLCDQVELHFSHYISQEEASEKWNHRLSKIHWDNLIVKFDDDKLCSEELLKEFDSLPYQNKICFTSKKYHLSSEILLSEFIGKDCVTLEGASYEKDFDIIAYLNNLMPTH